MAKRTESSASDKRLMLISRRVMLMAVFLLLAMIFISVRRPFYIALGVVFSILTIALPLYSLLTAEDIFVRIRIRYVLLFVVLSLTAYFATLGIANGDTALLRTIGSSLITATSIGAVFAGTIYEKVKEKTLVNRGKLSRRSIGISICIAIYPLLVSVIAVFASVMLLILASTNFIFSIFLCNATITAILVTLIMSVELLREDLARQLY